MGKRERAEWGRALQTLPLPLQPPRRRSWAPGAPRSQLQALGSLPSLCCPPSSLDPAVFAVRSQLPPCLSPKQEAAKWLSHCQLTTKLPQGQAKQTFSLSPPTLALHRPPPLTKGCGRATRNCTGHLPGVPRYGRGTKGLPSAAHLPLPPLLPFSVPGDSLRPHHMGWD